MKLVGNFKHGLKISIYFTWNGNQPRPHIFLCFVHSQSCYHSNQDFFREGPAVAEGVPSLGPRPVLTLVLCPDCSDRFRR